MVYSPRVVLIRDDDGEWRSPVEVDVLTSAAVNAGEIRRKLEKEERLRGERAKIEYWRKKGEEVYEKHVAERQKRWEINKAKEEMAKLDKEQGRLLKLNKETDKGKAKDSGIILIRDDVTAERQRLREKVKNEKEREEMAMLKEQANMKEEIAKLKNLVKEMGESKETDIGNLKTKESGSDCLLNKKWQLLRSRFRMVKGRR